jgi:hypothetical protein
MSTSPERPTSPPPRLATLDYLAEVVKDWVVRSFAEAEESTFALAPHRFELDGTTVRRRRLSHNAREATDPLGSVGRAPTPIAWARSDTVILLADAPDGSVAFEQEIVEVLGIEEDDIVAEAASVVRIPGLPPCLGQFWTVA